MQKQTLKYPFLFALIGFTAIIAQILFMREFLAIFYGNELSLGIMLANWLWWTATGSYLTGKCARRHKNPQTLMAILQILLAIFIPFTILLIRYSKSLFQTIPGELLGLFPIYLDSFIVLFPTCFIIGGLFSVASYLYATKENKKLGVSSGYVYLMESIGSAISGVFVYVLLLPYLDAMHSSLLLALFNIIVAIYLIFKNQPGRKRPVFLFSTVFLFIVLAITTISLESLSYKFLWPGFQVLESKNSKYGNLTLIQHHENKTVYENGLVLFNVPDQEAAEEAVHYALLQHPEPQRLLLIGGGLNGSLHEALKHPSIQHIDYIELDPAIVQLAQKHIQQNDKTAFQDSRLSTHHMDGRLFLQQTSNRYDVIIVNLADPHTAQLNRFYTREFFQTTADKLNPDGLFSFQVTASENYISHELAQYLACFNKTLKSVFSHVAFIPGNTVHFFASNSTTDFIINPDKLVQRLKERSISTQYIREYFIPFRLMPDRVQDLDNQIQATAQTKINKDFSPIAYYFDMVLWSKQFFPKIESFLRRFENSSFQAVLAAFLLPLLIILFYIRLKFTAIKKIITTSQFSVIAMGFSNMSLQVILLLAFQALYGYVYHFLAIIIAVFMLGMASGSFLALGHLKKKTLFDTKLAKIKGLTVVHAMTIILPFLLFITFLALRIIINPTLYLVTSHIIFPLMALTCGTVGGYEFPLASDIYFTTNKKSSQNSGIMYGLDLFGSLFGAILLSTFLVPLFGLLKTAIFISSLNLMVLFLIFLTKSASRIQD